MKQQILYDNLQSPKGQIKGFEDAIVTRVLPTKRKSLIILDYQTSVVAGAGLEPTSA